MNIKGLNQFSVLLSMFAIILTRVVNGDGGDDRTQEFCQNEEFRASCGTDDVIMMDWARYGRMRLSRCVKKDYGFIGCQKDVLDIADVICSGRHSCSIRVPNERLDAAKTDCPEDFKSYFEAKHSCIEVATPYDGSCRNRDQVVLTGQSGTIASIVTSETGCGNAHAPWLIQVLPGQRINVTLVDFAYGSLDNVADHTKCYAYASIKEMNSKRSTRVCGGRSRLTHAYTSIENKIRVVIFGSGTESNPKYFLLKYEAIGCPDPVMMKNGWFKRRGNYLEYGCNDSTHIYAANCNGTKWDRDVTNCSVTAAAKTSEINPFGFAMSYDIAIAIILAIAIVIASIILCVGIICMRRIRGVQSGRCQERFYGDRSQYLAQNVHNENRKEIYLPCQPGYEQYRTGENIYASIQETVTPSVCSCKPDTGDICPCRHEFGPEMSAPPRDPRLTTGSGPYSSLEQSCTAAVTPEPISPTSRSECSSIYPETGRPYYVLDPKDDLE